MPSFSSGFSNPQTASNPNAKSDASKARQSLLPPPLPEMPPPKFQDLNSLSKNHWQLVELELLLNHIDRNNADAKTVSTMQQFDRLWNQLDKQVGQGQYQAKPFLDDLLKRFNSLVSKHWDTTLSSQQHPINQYPQVTSHEVIALTGKEQLKQLKRRDERPSDKAASKSRFNGVRTLFQSAGPDGGGSVETETELAPPCQLSFTSDQLRREIEGLWQFLNQNPNAHHMQFEQLRYQFNAPLLSQNPQTADWLFEQWQRAPGPITSAASQVMTAQLLKKNMPLPSVPRSTSQPHSCRNISDSSFLTPLWLNP